MRPVRSRDVALLVAFLSGLLLAANHRLFVEPIYERSDFAANSLLVLEAKRGLLLHGNYSRVGCYHPGPALIWVMAAGEVAFHDALGVVPAPFNGQLVGCLLLEAGLIGLALGLAALAWGRGSPIPVLLPVWLGYLAWAEVFADAWFPNLYGFVYLALQIAAVAVAAGHHRALPWLAGTGGLAIHGHAGFVMFVTLLTAFAVGGMAWAYRSRVRDVWSRGRAAWVAAVVIWAAFAAPILVHTCRDYPGEIWRYVGYKRAMSIYSHPASEAVNYIWRVQTGGEEAGEFGTGLVILVAGSLALIGPRLGTAAQRRELAERGWGRVAGAALGAAAVSTVGVLYYSIGSVDHLDYLYVIRFSRTTLLVVGLPILYWLDTAGLGQRAASRVGGIASAAACLGLAGAGVLTWTGPKSAGGLEVADRIATDPRWSARRPVIVLEDDRWEDVAGLVVRLARRGRVPCTLGRWGSFSDGQYHPNDGDLSGGDPWLIGVTGPDVTDRLGWKRLGGWIGPDGRESVVWEVDPVARFGEPVPYVSDAHFLDVISTPVSSSSEGLDTRVRPDILSIPVRIAFAAPPPPAAKVVFELRPSMGRRLAEPSGALNVFVNGRPAGRVSYPRDRVSLHRLPVPIPAAELARPTLVTFRYDPPDSERGALLPSGEHYQAVGVISLKFDAPLQHFPGE